jgi:hypothetical protein
MKSLVRNLTVFGFLGGSSFAAPFLAIGDDAELFVTSEASAAYNNNILLAPASELEDTVFTFVPGLDLHFGKDSAISGNLFAISTLTSYSDNNDLNNQLFGIGSNAVYSTGGPLALSANASFNELDQATVDVISTTKLIGRDAIKLGVKGEMAFRRKSASAQVLLTKKPITKTRCTPESKTSDFRLMFTTS